MGPLGPVDCGMKSLWIRFASHRYHEITFRYVSEELGGQVNTSDFF